MFSQLIITILKFTITKSHDSPSGRLQDKGMSDVDAMECASYLSVLTFSAVGQLFTQAQQIKAWLNGSAYKIAETGKPVKWSTPLG